MDTSLTPVSGPSHSVTSASLLSSQQQQQQQQHAHIGNETNDEVINSPIGNTSTSEDTLLSNTPTNGPRSKPSGLIVTDTPEIITSTGMEELTPLPNRAADADAEWEGDEPRGKTGEELVEDDRVASESPFKTYRPPTPPSCERFSGRHDETEEEDNELGGGYSRLRRTGSTSRSVPQPSLPYYVRLWSFIRRIMPSESTTSEVVYPSRVEASLSPRSCLRSETDTGMFNSDRSRPICFSEQDVEVGGSSGTNVTPRTMLSPSIVTSIDKFEYVMSCLAPACDKLAMIPGSLPSPVVEGCIGSVLCLFNLSGTVPLLVPSEWDKFSAFLFLLVVERKRELLPPSAEKWNPSPSFVRTLREVSGLSPEELASLMNLCAEGVSS